MAGHIPIMGPVEAGRVKVAKGAERGLAHPFAIQAAYSISAVSLSVAPLLSVQEISTFSPLAAPVNLKNR